LHKRSSVHECRADPGTGDTPNDSTVARKEDALLRAVVTMQHRMRGMNAITDAADEVPPCAIAKTQPRESDRDLRPGWQLMNMCRGTGIADAG